MPTATLYEHIKLNNKGVPIIAGTGIKVVLFIEAQLARGYSPSDLREQYPHLSMEQIHSALAYYRDHKAELDADMERRRRLSKEILASLPPNPGLERLRAIKYGR